MSFKVPGTLNRVEVLEGERVTPGQLIASLNNYDVLHRLSDRQASYNLAQNSLTASRSSEPVMWCPRRILMCSAPLEILPWQH
ncbi:biotin/lipoyl-binding protein [Plesiomonas shigelloides subsp. oncorhynchi]|nr:biotin/lipoyl-binding protein [Plesiomonas shigelloides]